MAVFPVYPTDIPGLHTLDHALFPHAHYFAMDVGHDIMAGAAINEGDLEDAKGVAMVLKGLTGEVSLKCIGSSALMQLLLYL